MRALLTAVVLLASLSFAQVPATLGYSGRLLKPDGTAQTGTANVTFALYATATAGSPVWSETQSVLLTADGLYSVQLGAQTGFPAAVWDGSAPRFLELTVNGTTLSPREAVSSVAYALLSRSLKGGTVDATSIRVNGVEVIGSNGKVNASALQSCSAQGQVLSWDAASSGWVCGSATGPAGPTGPTGPQGPTGPTGPAGAPAVLPSGMIAFFAGPCPTGWTEYTALRGRAVVGVPQGGTVAGQAGTALTDLQQPTHTHGYSAVPAHTHPVDPPATTSGNQSADHTHSGTTSSGGDHTHGYTDGIPEIPWDGTYGAQSGGTSLHREYYAKTTGSAGNHNHTVTTGGVSANHTHTVDIASFTSGSTGVAAPTTDPGTAVMPYLQLTACITP